MKICIAHYSAPPVIGGVEKLVGFQAAHLAKAGHDVTLLCASGGMPEHGVRTHTIERMAASHPVVATMNAELAAGHVPAGFDALVDDFSRDIEPVLNDAEVIVVHNICVVHKNLALSVAMRNLCERQPRRQRWFGYHHDAAWCMPQYLHELHPGHPWSVLREPWPGMRHITISSSRQHALAGLFGIPGEAIHVIEPGLDIDQFLGITPTTSTVQRLVANADLVILLPARVTRRKNIGFALELLHQLRLQTSLDIHLVVSGPPGPHNPSNQHYLKELFSSRDALGLTGCCHFLYQSVSKALDDDDMTSLYRLCDMVLLPSLDEGFGLPALEALAAGRLFVCSRLPSLVKTARGAAVYLDIEYGASKAAQTVCAALETRLDLLERRRILRHHDWNDIIRTQLMPLLEAEYD